MNAIIIIIFMTRPPQQAIMAKDIMPCDTETGQDTELSQSGYCDVDFVDPPPDSLQCPVCLSTLKQPHILSCCGSLMCENCIGCVQANGQPCPCCRETDYMHFLDKRTRGKILELKVQCSKDGCDWEGELGDLERHLSNKCLYVEEMCPHGCGQSYPRHILQAHQLDECPQRSIQFQLETLQRQLIHLQQQLAQQQKKQEEDKRELQQLLAQQKEKHEELQQQLLQQEKMCQESMRLQHEPAQQEKKHKEDKELQCQIAQQERKREEDKRELLHNIAQQERKHEEDKRELLHKLAQQERKHEEDKRELLHKLAQHERKHEEDIRELQQQVATRENK